MYYILEHPIKGVVREFAFDEWPYVRPTIRWSKRGRRDAMKTFELQVIIEAHDVIMRQASRGNRLNQTKILRSVDWNWYCRECGEWIDTTDNREDGHLSDCPYISD